MENTCLPGASGAAIIWFLATLAFGFYLTRFADYSVVYGPLGAVVATLVWLYIATVSVLIGAEFNAHVLPQAPAVWPGGCPKAGRDHGNGWPGHPTLNQSLEASAQFHSKGGRA